MSMFKRIVVAAGLFVMAGSPAFAQGRVEVSVFGGWTFSDGVSLDGAILAGDGNLYDRVDPKDAGSFGFSIGVLASENAEVGFIYGLEPSSLVFGGTNEREVGDLDVTTYHGYFAYNWGAADSPVRPFLFGGLGATNFGTVDVTVAGVNRSIGGQTQFSTTWGGGVKFYPAPRFGVRAALRFTPTYIKTDEEGWWCDPYWGCWVVGNAQYSNQFEFSGGVTFRF
jgi:hypothetical protein